MNVKGKICLIAGVLFGTVSGRSQVFHGTPSSDWVLVEGCTSIKIPRGEQLDREGLLNMAQQEAIEKKFGTSIVYGNFMKSYESELRHSEIYIDLTSQFPQGVWKADLIEPEWSSGEAEIIKANRRGELKKKVPAIEWTCKVKGYAQPLKQILPQFEFQVLNGRKQVIVEQTVQKAGAKLSVGVDSVFRQGDLFITRFRCTKSGHLVLFMDNGENAFRMLPYAAFDHQDDVMLEPNRWYSFFDLSAVPVKEREYVDELELLTDREYDAIRVYYLFSETPFTKDFFFTIGDAGRNDLPKGYSELPSITSRQFTLWLQQNRIRKPDLQVSVVDLIVDNLNRKVE
nr:hypothetical protein [Bacteroides acidifaciens]